LQLELLLRSCKAAQAAFVPASNSIKSQIIVTEADGVKQSLDFDPATFDFFTGDTSVHLLTHCDVSGSRDALIALSKRPPIQIRRLRQPTR
jgi:hypothetical protein